jgi:hypothetical protein
VVESERRPYPDGARLASRFVADRPEPLTVDAVDLESLVLARNDGHPERDWWFDPRTGASLYHGLADDSDLPELVEGVHVHIPYDPQPRSDVDDFFTSAPELGVDDATLAHLYETYRGKGGFRRFRDRVASSPAAEAWRRFTLEREKVRAVAWLESRGLVVEPGRR